LEVGCSNRSEQSNSAMLFSAISRASLSISNE
jgi:hypothetical protein